MNDWIKKGREIAEYIKQLETERDSWMQWCQSAEKQIGHLMGKLETIRREADVRQGVHYVNEFYPDDDGDIGE